MKKALSSYKVLVASGRPCSQLHAQDHTDKYYRYSLKVARHATAVDTPMGHISLALAMS